MDSSSRPVSAMSSWQQRPADTLARPVSALSHSLRSPSPGGGSFRPASAASRATFVSTSSHIRDAHAAKYTPTTSEAMYDNNPPLGIFRQQLQRNSWFLKNQQAASQLRLGRPICKEIPVPARLLGGSMGASSLSPLRGLGTASRTSSRAPLSLSVNALSRPSSAADASGSSVSRRLRLQVNTNRGGSALSRASTAAGSNASSKPPERVPFGTLVEDAVGMVADLNRWAPPQQDAKPESLPSHYRTTTKHGSTAHTIWDFIWETPVLRSDRIKQEIQLPEAF